MRLSPSAVAPKTVKATLAETQIDHETFIGSRVALFSILKEIKESVQKITGILAPPDSKIDRLKRCLNPLWSTERIEFSDQWIYERLLETLQLLKDPSIRQELSSQINLDLLENRIQQVYLGFYPLVQNGLSLREIRPLAEKIRKKDSSEDEGEKKQINIHEELTRLLKEAGGREDYYQSKALNNPAKRAAFRFLDYALSFRNYAGDYLFSEAFIWSALWLLLMTSENPSDARDKFGAFFNREFRQRVTKGEHGALGMLFQGGFDLKSATYKEISEDQITSIFLPMLDALSENKQDAPLQHLQFRTLWALVSYDGHLEGEELIGKKRASFYHYQKLGAKKGLSTNIGKREAAQDLFYSLSTGASETELLMAMSRFVFHSKPKSEGIEIFKPLYLKTCAEDFNKFLEPAGETLGMISSKEKLQDDGSAHWILYAALHSVMMKYEKIFKEDLVGGKKRTLKDLAAGIGMEFDNKQDSKLAKTAKIDKPLKLALLKLKISLEQGANLSQLVAVAQLVQNTLKQNLGNTEYHYAAGEVRRIYEIYDQARLGGKADVFESDISEDSFKDEFRSLYESDIKKIIEGIAKESKTKLLLQLANLRVKIEHAPREEIYLAIIKLLNEYGDEIKSYSEDLYKALRNTFLGAATKYQIQALDNYSAQMIYVPGCMKYQSSDQYFFEPFPIQMTENSSVGPALSSALFQFINPAPMLGSSGAYEVDLEPTRQESNQYCISISKSKTLILKIKVENLQGKTNITIEKCLPSEAKKISHFDALEISEQIRILNGLADALSKVLQDVKEPASEVNKQLKLVFQAGDFLSVKQASAKLQAQLLTTEVMPAAESRSRSSSYGGVFSRSSRGQMGSVPTSTPAESPAPVTKKKGADGLVSGVKNFFSRRSGAEAGKDLSTSGERMAATSPALFTEPPLEGPSTKLLKAPESLFTPGLGKPDGSEK